MSKKVVISGYYGFGNFGDEAILSVLVNKLKTFNADITVFSSSPDAAASRYSVNSVYTFDYIKVFDAIRRSDILVSGGGSLLQDATSLKSLLYYLAVIACALITSKKVIIFAQGIGPINNKFASFLTTWLLKRCTYVSVRDKKSADFLEKHKIKADLLCDPIYSIDIPVVEKKGAAGIQLREFKTINDEFLKKLAENIAYEFADKKIELFSLQKTHDLELCKRFEVMLKTYNKQLETEIVETDLIERLSALEYLIGMRFHALLIALKAGVKCLAINYDTKVEMLAESSEIPLAEISPNYDLKTAFSKMKNLDKNKINKFAQSNRFDWANLEKEFY